MSKVTLTTVVRKTWIGQQFDCTKEQQLFKTLSKIAMTKRSKSGGRLRAIRVLALTPSPSETMCHYITVLNNTTNLTWIKPKNLPPPPPKK